MCKKFNLILAKTEKNGIGYKGGLPWRLKNELGYFQRMTKDVTDPKKKNAVIMGRKTWESMPDGFKPLAGRLNIVLSSKELKRDGVIHCYNLKEVIDKMSKPEYAENIETLWVIGGARVYEECIKDNLTHRIYMTHILKDFPADTFVNINVDEGFTEVVDPRVPTEMQSENGTNYVFKVYEKV